MAQPGLGGPRQRAVRYVRVLHCLGCMEEAGEAVLNDELATTGSPLFSREELDASHQVELIETRRWCGAPLYGGDTAAAQVNDHSLRLITESA